MEARQTLRETSVPKGLIAVLSISVVVALAAMGAAVAKDLAGSGAPAAATYHAAPGTVLRQDNPPQGMIDRGAERGAQTSAAVGTHPGRSSGNQAVGDDPGLSAGSQGAASNPGWDARSVREGHGV